MIVTKAISLLKDAIAKVEPCYIRIEALPNRNIKKIQVERSFAYELYLQWSLVLNEYKKTHPDDANLRLNGEISKDLDLKTRVYPDMVLHGGQGNIHSQVLVCEIKRVDGNYPSNKHILVDLYKLTRFLNLTISYGEGTRDVHYKCATYIVANIDASDLKTRLRNALSYSKCKWTEEIKANADKITCFSVEVTDGPKLKVSKFKLSSII